MHAAVITAGIIFLCDFLVSGAKTIVCEQGHKYVTIIIMS